MAQTPRMAVCGGLMIGLNWVMPNVPRLVMENVPPVTSSVASLPSLAFAARPFNAALNSPRLWPARP